MLTKSKQLLTLIVLLTMSFVAFAQNHTVTGTVIDAQGPVIGATVMIEGTSIGASTDVDGKYTLEGVSPSANLVFSCIGYVSQTYRAGNQSVIDVTLVEDMEMIEETVVVGYGVQKKSDVTGAISQVKSEDMENRTISSADQALQGKTSGVVVIMGSAAPGSSPTVRVRGFSSNSSSDPLYVVDGLRVKPSDVSGIDPNTIESMEVLKDAASAAIYGAQAGNGVVLITTKKGTKGTAKFMYEFQHTIENLAYMPDVLNAKDYITYYTEKSGDTFTQLVNTYYDGHTDTDWIKESFETSHMNRHVLTVNAANDKGSYFLSGSYMNNDGIIYGDKDSFTRFTLAFNGDYKINKWLNVSSNVSMDRSQTASGFREGSIMTGSFASSVLMTDPLTPIYGMTNYMQSILDAGYPLLGDENGYYTSSEFFSSQQTHPISQLATRDNNTKRFQVRGNIALNFTPFKGFTFTSRLGYRESASFTNTISYRYRFNSQRSSDYNTVSSSSSMMQYYQWENFVNYMFSLGKHNFTAMAGMSFDETNIGSLSASVNAVMKEDPLYQYLDYQAASATKTAGGDDTFATNLSYFGRLNWDYDGKYMLQASLRADAADLSRLSSSARWGYFPAASFGWVISKEGFFSGINKDKFSYLKFRASWGQNGSIAGLSNYMWRSSIGDNGFYNLVDGTSTNKYTAGMMPTTLGNDSLTWETSEQTDLGLDFRFLKDKLTLTADYYWKKTENLIVSGATPSLVVGNTSSPINGGNVINRGLELDATWKSSIGNDFKYSISANLATLHNEVTYVSEYVSGKLAGASMNTYTELTMFEAGYPVWYFNGYKFTGIDKSTGYPQFEDVNGDGSISAADKVFIGSAIPDYTYGITLTASYKSFDLTVFGTGSHGNQIYQWLSRPDNPGSNILQKNFDNRWTNSNTEGTYPVANTPNDLMANYTFSSANVKDASYFKIKQIQLGYSIPKNLLGKVFLSNARAYVSLDDYFIFTKYDGFDPEASAASISVMQTGIDAGSFPSSKKVVFGINVTF